MRFKCMQLPCVCVCLQDSLFQSLVIESNITLCTDKVREAAKKEGEGGGKDRTTLEKEPFLKL